MIWIHVILSRDFNKFSGHFRNASSPFKIIPWMVSAARGVEVLTNALNKILEIKSEDMYAVVQPGVVTTKLAAAVESKSLFYPPGPEA
jgi:hypothetical protein